MRNKQKQASPFRWMLRRYLFLLVTVIMVTFAVFPMQGMIRVLTTRQFLDHLETPLERTDQVFYTKELTLNFVYSPLNLELLCVLFGGMGFAAAMVLFRHLFSRKQGMMYAALPMKKEQDFWLRAGVYGVLCLLPMALCLVIHPIMVRTYGLWHLFSFPQYLARAGVTLLINFYGFVLGVLCACVAGTMWSAVLGALMLSVSVEVALICWIQMGCFYLNTMNRDVMIRAMLRFSPVYSLYKAFYQPMKVIPWSGMVAILLLLGLALGARKRVRPENAGHTLNLKKLEPVILGWAVALGCTAGAMVLNLYWGEEYTLYVGALMGAVVVWQLGKMLLDQRVRLTGRGWQVTGVALTCALLVFLGLRTDVIGYNSFAPKAESLKTITLQPYFSREEEMIFDSQEGLEACLEWVGQARDEMAEDRKQHPYYRNASSTLVIFEKKNGQKIIRQYRFPEKTAAVILALRVMAAEWSQYESEHLPNLPRVNAYSGLNTYGLSSNEIWETFGFNPEVRLRINPAELKETLRKDLAERTLEQMQTPRIFRVYMDGADPEKDPMNNYSFASFEITLSDRHTLDLLLGEDADKWIDFAQGGFARSEEIRVFLCDYELDENEEWQLVSWRLGKDEKEVREWMTHMTHCNEGVFEWPTDPAQRVQIYSLTQIRDRMQYDEEFTLDLEDPEVLDNLPREQDVWCNSYSVMIPANV